MKNAIIVHGRPPKDEYYDPTVPSCSNFHWIPWLQKQLLVKDIAAQTPEIPNAWKPDYPTWCHEFERFEISPQTLLVGHSCGGGFLVRWLSEHTDIQTGKVILVAPWLDPNREATTDFFDFAIDPLLASRSASLTIFNSDNDHQSIHTSVKLLREVIKNIQYQEFHNFGHFIQEDMHSVEFTELLEALID